MTCRIWSRFDAETEAR